VPFAVRPAHPLVRLALGAFAAGVFGCTDPVSRISIGPTLKVSPVSVNAVSGQSVTLEVTLFDLPEASPVRWRSSDSTIFRLDTTTTAPHRVVGRAGRVGPTAVVVSVAGQYMTLPVTITQLASGAAR
jgi:hypothetical protein